MLSLCFPKTGGVSSCSWSQTRTRWAGFDLKKQLSVCWEDVLPSVTAVSQSQMHRQTPRFRAFVSVVPLESKMRFEDISWRPPFWWTNKHSPAVGFPPHITASAGGQFHAGRRQLWLTLESDQGGDRQLELHCGRVGRWLAQLCGVAPATTTLISRAFLPSFLP
ncbi:hypothetical protein N657DRAFT_235472 [Parathielavia appendiculata]|uniref:Uncharacterized protein n=1 Tax=Parathielavia appendiculata TaxID=2587402 RepID=A0AAN6U7M1_9PEZI|nr:hypothetical protein N657DRAFT_235472 [Parathielavia appendiculata]